MSGINANSRYATIDQTKLKTQDGKEIVYLKRRFLPSPDNFTVVQEHVVSQGERLDQIASATLGDPERFWQICDANNAMRPDDLTTEPGRHLKITLSEGISGSPYA